VFSSDLTLNNKKFSDIEIQKNLRMIVIEKKVESLVISNEENCKRIIEMEVVCKDLYLKVNDLIDKVITFSINTRVAVHFFLFEFLSSSCYKPSRTFWNILDHSLAF